MLGAQELVGFIDRAFQIADIALVALARILVPQQAMTKHVAFEGGEVLLEQGRTQGLAGEIGVALRVIEADERADRDRRDQANARDDGGRDLNGQALIDRLGFQLAGGPGGGAATIHAARPDFFVWISIAARPFL